jgi:hypothetical protein
MTSHEPQAVPGPDPLPDPAERLEELLGGYQDTQALYVAAKLNLADALRDGPKSATELATTVGAHAPSLLRLMRYLVRVGVLAEAEGDRFALTSLGEPLRSDHPDSLQSLAILYGSPLIWRPFGELYDAVVTGDRAFERAFGLPYFEYLDRHKKDAAVFNAVMSAGLPLDLFDAYDFSSFHTIVDVGGGQGAFLQAILDRSPQTHGVLYDLPAVVEQASVSANADVMARFETMAGDMFASVPTGGDAYLLKRIVHDWSDEEAARILRNCRQAMNEGGKVLLIEQVLHPGRFSEFATAIDLQMMVLVSGRERTEEEYRALLAAAGLQLTRVISAGSRSLIEAKAL